MTIIPSRLQARLAIAGNFEAPEFEMEARNNPGWEHVEFLGWRSREQVAALLASARLGLVLYHPVPVHEGAQPNKLFEYMSAGIPVVASDFPLWTEIVQGSKCGLVADPHNPKAISEAIRWLLEHPAEAEQMGRRGLEAVRSRFNWTNEAEKLLYLYRGYFSEHPLRENQ